MAEKIFEIGRQFRDFTIIREDIDKEKRTVILSFSSEEKVERYWGIEILDHKEKSVNLRRLKRGGALLIDHDTRNQVGVIEKVTIDEVDRKGRAIVRFGRSAKAEEIFQDVVDRIRQNVSVGYEVHEMVLEEAHDNAPNVYRIIKWEPLEISLVSIPADISVGVSRDEKDKKEIRVLIPDKKEEIRKMDKCAKCGADLVEGKCPTCDAIAARAADIKVIDTAVNKSNAVEMEKARKKAIENLCKANTLGDKYRDYFIGTGIPLEEVAEDILRILEERGKSNPQSASKIGLTAPETQRFSLVRAITACVDKDWTNAPFELDCSRAVAKKLGKVQNPTSFLIPYEVLERKVEQRDLSTAAGGGGYLVSTDNIGFIEMLRNRSVAFRMGVRRLSGLVGNVTIPKQSAAATAYWLADETTSITESAQTFVQLPLTPKNVGAYTEISRQLLLQSSPGAEGLVTADLAAVVALAADYGVLNGGGTAEPTGIIGTGSIGGVTGTALAYAGILEFQTDVAANNVIPAAGGYVTTAAVAGLMKARMKVTNDYSPLWEGNLWDGTMDGFKAMSSAQMPSATMLFGDWSEIVVGEWGVLEVDVNPYANFAAGIIGVRAIYSMDVAVRRPQAFSYAHTIT